MNRKRRTTSVAPVAAAMAWSTLGLKWMEMMGASGQVITRRTRRAPTPSQWMHMGSEKVQAATRSNVAMASRMATLPYSNPMAMWGAWASLLSAGMAPYRTKAVSNARRRR